jgi:Fe-S cluster assembly ATPase SufC
LVQRIRDDFGLDLAERYAAWQPEAVDWDAVAEEIRELQGKIERLGAVNLEAIEEQEALEKRVTFLRQQRDDLVKAREALTGLIDRINRESRERFQKTFEAVRAHFQELFRKLFGGGKADVYLENPEDVLETGIEVVARPPGKQLQRISLLSGGEKTMTAVALLLAIFRARPSPFCILDEVDAALDESNVERFTGLVREFLDQSQFVIITHNKRTMSIADVIYGVTMGEPGVSRKVSVKFSDMHEKGYVTATDDEAGERAAVSEAGPAPDVSRGSETAPVEVAAAGPAPDVSRGSQAEAAEPVALPTGAAIAAVASSAKEADRAEAATPTEAAETEAAAAARPSGQPSDANAVPAK